MRRLRLVVVLSILFCPLPVWAKKIAGTYFYGGAGMEGGYVADMVRALRAAGIQNVAIGKCQAWMESMPPPLQGYGFIRDASFGVVHFYDAKIDTRFETGDFQNDTGQFNLIGYSFGGAVVANIARKLAAEGHRIDYVVLIAAPISLDNLEDLNNNQNIGEVIVINLDEYGDPIFAGMALWRLYNPWTIAVLGVQKIGDDGHFYFAGNTIVGSERRDAMAAQLYQHGLR